jgi:hypothetical protein
MHTSDKNFMYVCSLYFLRYSMWKLGFLNGPEISFKHVSFPFSL